jgi:hypothetical protein
VASGATSPKLLMLMLAGALILPAPAASATTGWAARSLSVNDTAQLKLVHQAGEDITEEGQAKGEVPGHVKLLLELGPTVVARFTITAAGGSISGIGSGKPKGRSAEPSFAGTMKVTHGSGLYSRAHGSGGFYGTLNRRTYKMVVQTTGTLDY